MTMAKRKLTAKQKRERKARERAQRAAYEKRLEQRSQKSQKPQASKPEPPRVVGKPAAEVSRLSLSQLRKELTSMTKKARGKYDRLIRAGLRGQASAAYERDIMDISPDIKNVNVGRHLYRKLAGWMSRRDVSVKGARRLQAAQQNFFDKNDVPIDVYDYESNKKFWEVFRRLEESDAAFYQQMMRACDTLARDIGEYFDPDATVDDLVEVGEEHARKLYEEKRKSERRVADYFDEVDGGVEI